MYLITDPDGLTVIDTGLARSGRPLLTAIAQLGHAPGDLRRIIVTHADGDHTNGLAALKMASGAPAFAHPLEATALAGGHSSRPMKTSGLRGWLFAAVAPWFTARPVTVEQTLADGQMLPVLGGLQVIFTPGHTPGHISLFAPGAGMLFCGDSLVASRGSLHLSEPAYTWDRPQTIQSARKQAALGARFVCPGHGPVVVDATGKFPAV
jgi:glyoxylase-like metal-dependent hydrolase (beta-lactamase superfamily II)